MKRNVSSILKKLDGKEVLLRIANQVEISKPETYQDILNNHLIDCGKWCKL